MGINKQTFKWSVVGDPDVWPASAGCEIWDFADDDIRWVDSKPAKLSDMRAMASLYRRGVK